MGRELPLERPDIMGMITSDREQAQNRGKGADHKRPRRVRRSFLSVSNACRRREGLLCNVSGDAWLQIWGWVCLAL